MLFGFRIINDILILIDLKQGPFKKFIHKFIPGNFKLLKNLLVINDTLDDLKLFPFNQTLKIAQKQLLFSHVIIHILLEIQQNCHHIPTKLKRNLIPLQYDVIFFHSLVEICSKESLEDFVVPLVFKNFEVRFLLQVECVEDLKATPNLVYLADFYGQFLCQLDFLHDVQESLGVRFLSNLKLFTEPIND